MKKYAAIILMIIFLITAFGCKKADKKEEAEYISEEAESSAFTEEQSEEEAEEQSGEEKNFDGYKVTVLGDSIAYGYGLTDPGKQRFSSLIEKKLEKTGGNADIFNFAVNGMTGEELAEFLRVCKATTLIDDPELTFPDNDFGTERGMGYEFAPQDYANCRCALNISDAVIISIGGNDILMPFYKYITERELFDGIDEKLFKDYFIYVLNSNESKKYAVDELNGLFYEANRVFGSEDINKMTEKASVRLYDEICAVTQTLHEINPNLKIFIQTVYNPFGNFSIKLPHITENTDISVYGEEAVGKLNRAIYEGEVNCRYTVVDVKEAFDGAKKRYTGFGFDLTEMNFGFDIHPNAYGHGIIADLYFKAISEAEK